MPKNDIVFFQKGMFEVVEGKGRASFPFHSHQSFLVGVIKSGKAILKFNEKEYELQGGMTYVVPSEVGFSMRPITAYYSYLTLCIKADSKNTLMQYFSKATVIFDIGESICDLCENFKAGINENNFFSGLVDILNLENRERIEISEQSGPNDFIAEAVTFIDEHIEEKITLDDLAKKVHVSKYHLLREFKKRMSVTPKQYLSQSKMRYVRQKVMSVRTTAQIAADMNFSAQSHLCSVFKKYMGISVDDYKSNVTKEKEQ